MQILIHRFRDLPFYTEKNLSLTVDQAMDALGIPAADQPKYLAKL